MELWSLEFQANYVDYQVKHWGAKVHPENYKILKESLYLAQNNLPVPRMHLYIALPELFDYAVEDIEEVERDQLREKRILLGFVSSAARERPDRLLY